MSRYSVADVSTLFLLLYLTRTDSLRYFWRPTGRIAGTKREFTTNAVIYGVKISQFNRESSDKWGEDFPV